MELTQALGIIGVSFSILTAVVAVTLYVRGSYAKVRIEALRADLDDERKSSESLRARVTDLEKENERANARLDGLERENDILKKQPTLDLNKLLLAMQDFKREWSLKLDGLVKTMNARFDKLEGK